MIMLMYSMPLQPVPCLVFFLGLNLLVGYANAHAMTTISQDRVTTHKLSIRYDKSWINAQILNTPLGAVCRELERKTGVRFVLNDPHVATRPVSATFKGLPLREGLKKVLAGFSYAIYPDAETGGIKINVLAGVEGSVSTDPAAVGSTPPSEMDSHMPASLPPSATAGMPLSVEGFRSVAVEETEARSAGKQEIQAREQEHQEALLQHLLGVLDSENPRLHTETLALLQGMDDPRATEMLVAAALDGSQDNQARVQAVEILRRHAADLEYRDEASVDALKQLAYGGDRQAAKVARQAVQRMEEMEEYEQHSAAP